MHGAFMSIKLSFIWTSGVPSIFLEIWSWRLNGLRTQTIKILPHKVVKSWHENGGSLDYLIMLGFTLWCLQSELSVTELAELVRDWVGIRLSAFSWCDQGLVTTWGSIFSNVGYWLLLWPLTFSMGWLLVKLRVLECKPIGYSFLLFGAL